MTEYMDKGTVGEEIAAWALAIGGLIALVQFVVFMATAVSP